MHERTAQRCRQAIVGLHLPSLASMVPLVLVVLFVRLALGIEFPIPWNDETAFISQAFEFSRTGSFYVYGLNSERVVMWVPPGHMLLMAGIYKLFGYSYEISRWVSAVLFLGVFAVFLLILRDCLNGWRRNFALVLLLLALAQRVVRELTSGTTFSFGYTGTEPFFFADFASAAARWSGSAHSVTRVFPQRTLDYRVLCDSAMFPAYLSTYDWDGNPRKSEDSGCHIIPLSSGGTK